MFIKTINAIMWVFLVLNVICVWIAFIEVCFGNYSHAMSIINNGGIAFGLYFAIKLK